MIAQYHILNGDALKEQFPNRIAGEIIVCSECLVDGPVDGETLDDLFETRANFIAISYDGFSEEGYYETALLEFNLIQGIPSGSEINLWFEDDLFCQVNLWFVCDLLKEHSENCTINLVRPGEPNPYNFGKLNDSELISIFDERKLLKELDKLAELWKFYQKGKTKEMLKIGRDLKEGLPFLLPAIQAHVDRKPSNGDLGRPVQSLKEIKEELNTNNFSEIFKEFSKRNSIYGFGDLQVKRILDELQ